MEFEFQGWGQEKGWGLGFRSSNGVQGSRLGSGAGMGFARMDGVWALELGFGEEMIQHQLPSHTKHQHPVKATGITQGMQSN